MELSPYHTHRFPSSPSIGSPVTVQNGLPGPNGHQNPDGTYGTFDPNDPHAPLLPATQSRRSQASVYPDLIPFASWWIAFRNLFRRNKEVTGTAHAGPAGSNAGKHVVIAGGGGNIPLEILRCLSEWMGTLEERGTVPGTTLGGMIGLISGLEDSLTLLERILTTPLPL
jgi:ion channel-forming bestrophin family protein